MTMYVDAPEQERIQIRNLYDQVMHETEPPYLDDGSKNPDVGKERLAVKVYQDWLLDRTTDERFFTHGSKKEGYEALKLIRLARRQIQATRGKPGPHAFDDDVLERLQACILKPSAGHLGNVAFEHNWFDWSRLWEKPHSQLPAVMDQAAEEGQDK